MMEVTPNGRKIPVMSFKLDDDTTGLFKSLEPTKRELKEGKEDVKWSCAKCHVLKKRVDLKFCSRVRPSPVLAASGLRSSLTCGVPFHSAGSRCTALPKYVFGK
jgi:hypothetical protein